MSTTKNNFWKGLAEVGKNILAHVNITYDGVQGSIHIDIVPTEQQRLTPESQKVISQPAAQELLPGSAQEEQEEAKSDGNLESQPNGN